MGKISKLLTVVLGGVLLVFSLAGCATTKAFYHTYIMRGTIVDSSPPRVVLCIGRRDGAEVGQELEVYEIEKEYSENPELEDTFTRNLTGKVRITEIFDDHFAKVLIIEGTAVVGSVVELTGIGAR